MNHSDFLPAANPPLSDLKSCDAWLSQATLADGRQACRALLSLLDELDDAPPPHAAYLGILERLRPAVFASVEQQEKKFLGKSLPLGEAEESAFNQVCDLWMALQRAYRRLLNAAFKDPRAGLDAAQALLALRPLECIAELIGAHLLARREIDDDVWHWLHDAWAQAETRGLEDAPVNTRWAHAHDGTPCPATCTDAYVWPLLLHLANPYGLPPRELVWARRWAQRWAHKAQLSRYAKHGGFAVDLSAGCGLTWMDAARAGGPVRFVQAGRIARSLRKRAELLQDGALPAELGLGRDCTFPAAVELLMSLASCWSENPAPRQFPRRATTTTTRVLSGMAGIHFALGGRLASPAAQPWDYSRHDVDQIHVFQRAVDAAARHAQQSAHSAPSAAESWQALDESANGFRLRRSGQGSRMAHRQLIALLPQGARQLILCQVRWLRQGPDRALTIGTRALPGLPQCCVVRVPSPDKIRREPAFPAFLLPIATGLPPSLVLPAGWYQNERILQLEFEHKTMSIRLSALLGRGYDFERVNFAVTG